MKIKPPLILTMLAQLCFMPVLGQSARFPEDSVISIDGFESEGGLVNAVSGEVTCACESLENKGLVLRQKLGNGETVNTGVSAFAEILLLPGYVLRVGSNSQVRLIDLSPNNTRIRLERGAVIFEVMENQLEDFFVYDRTLYNLVTVSAGDDKFAITKGGIYRVDFQGDKPAEFIVYKGSSIVQGLKIESGRKASIANGMPSIVKFDKTSGDEFDNWSRDRAQVLVKANKLLKNADWYRHLRKKPMSYFDIEDPQEQSKEAREQLLITASSGKVNLADKGAMHRQPQDEWTELKEGERLLSGEFVKTDRDSRAEINLYAYTYLHIAEETEISFDDEEQNGITVKVEHGTAIINSVDTGAFQPIRLAGPQIDVLLVKSGVYRVDVGPAGETTITVFEGKAKAADLEIKSGKRLRRNGPTTNLESAKKKPQDTFDLWSRERTKISTIDFYFERQALARSRRNRSKYKGLWCLVPEGNFYTFVPGIWPFSSPYKGDYSVRFRA